MSLFKNKKEFVEEYAKKRGIEWINPDILEFQKHTDLYQKEYALIEMPDVSYSEALDKIASLGLRSASLRDLLLWEGWDGKMQVNALGTLVDANNEKHIPCLCFTHYSEPERVYTLKRLALLNTKFQWKGPNWFLVIKN